MCRRFPAWKDEGGRALEAGRTKTRATGLPWKPWCSISWSWSWFDFYLMIQWGGQAGGSSNMMMKLSRWSMVMMLMMMAMKMKMKMSRWRLAHGAHWGRAMRWDKHFWNFSNKYFQMETFQINICSIETFPTSFSAIETQLASNIGFNWTEVKYSSFQLNCSQTWSDQIQLAAINFFTSAEIR